MKTIDADGHVIEPADLWERELPASLREQEAGWITGAVLRVDGGIVVQ